MKEYFNGETGFVRVTCLAATVLAVALGIFNGILNVLFFEEKIYMYERGSENALTAYYAVCALTVAFFAVLYVVNKKRKNTSDVAVSVARNEDEGMAFRCLRMLGGAIFAVGAAVRFVSFFTAKNTTGLPDIAVIPMLIFFLSLALYFFPEINGKTGATNFTSVCGMLGAVAFIIDTLAVYADMSIPIASEYRLFTAVCTVLFMLALVSELRIRVAEPNPYGYIALIAIAATVAGSTCIGRAVSMAAGKTVSVTELARTVCGLGITVYLLSRLLSAVFAPVYLEDCGGIPFIIEPPLEGDTIENCGESRPSKPLAPESAEGETESEVNTSEDAE